MSDSRRLAQELYEIRSLALSHATSPQLGVSSVDGEGLVFRDGDGNDLGRIGGGENGMEVEYLYGPKPPQPSAPDVSADTNLISVRWDGLWADQSETDPDIVGSPVLDRVEVHVSSDENFVPDQIESLAGTMPVLDSGGQILVGPLAEAGDWYVVLLARGKDGQYGEPSDRVHVVTSVGLVENELFDLALRAGEAMESADGKNSVYYGDTAPEPQPRLDEDGDPVLDDDGEPLFSEFTEGDIWFGPGNMPHVWSETDGWVSAADERVDAIQSAVDDLESALDDVIVGAGMKSFYRGTMPTVEESSEGDLWFDVSDEYHPYRFTDGVWVSVLAGLADGSVTTDKIAEGAITAASGIIGSLDAGKITVGEMDGARIRAGSIAADRVLVGSGGSIVPNGGFKSDAGWVLSGDASIHPAGAVESAPGAGEAVTSEPLVWAANSVMVVSVTYPSLYPAPGLFIDYLDVVSGNPDRHVLDGLESSVSGSATTLSMRHQLGPVMGSPRLGVSIPAGGGVYSVDVRPPVGSTLIEPGSITTDKIQAGAVTTEKITAGGIDAGVITTGELRGELIRAESIAASALAATAIDGKTITGATVRTAAAGARVEMNSTGLYVKNQFGTNTVSMTNGELTVSGGTITGGTIRTSASGARVQLDVTGLKAWSPSNVETFSISANTGTVSMTGDLFQTNDYGDIAIGPRLFGGSSPSLRFRKRGEAAESDAGISMFDGGGRSALLLYGAGSNTSSQGRSVLQLPHGESTGPAGLYRYKSGSTIGTMRVNNTGQAVVSSSYGVQLTKSNTGGNDWIGLGYDGSWNSQGIYIRTLGDLTLYNGRMSVPNLNSTTGTANLRRTSNGFVGVIGSSRSLKIAEEPITVTVPDFADRLLSVDSVTWFDKASAERVAAAETEKANGIVPLDDLDDVDPLRRIPGVIAEDLHDAGLGVLVEYDSEGAPSSVMYDRIGAVLIPVVRGLRDRINELEERMGMMVDG